MQLNCSHCQSTIEERNIDQVNKIYYCSTCEQYGKITSLDSINQLKNQLKSHIEQPKNISITKEEHQTIIIVKKTTGQILRLIPLILAMGAIVVAIYFTTKSGDMISLIMGSLFSLFLWHLILSKILYREQLIISKEYLTTYIRKYWTFSYQMQYKIALVDIQQLFVNARKIQGKDRAHNVYDLMVKQKSETKPLLKDFNESRSLFFLEKYIEAQLGIQDDSSFDKTVNISSVIPSFSDILKMIRNR